MLAVVSIGVAVAGRGVGEGGIGVKVGVEVGVNVGGIWVGDGSISSSVGVSVGVSVITGETAGVKVSEPLLDSRVLCVHPLTKSNSRI
jgi:hypothetical protein